MPNYAEPFIKDDSLYKEMKKSYLKAKEEKAEGFDFHGQHCLTKFAYYLLTFVDMERKRCNLKIVKPVIDETQKP